MCEGNLSVPMQHMVQRAEVNIHRLSYLPHLNSSCAAYSISLVVLPLHWYMCICPSYCCNSGLRGVRYLESVSKLFWAGLAIWFVCP